jgi:hypothetical protein
MVVIVVLVLVLFIEILLKVVMNPCALGEGFPGLW